MYDTLTAPPEPSSLQEAICYEVFSSREEYETLAWLATVLPPGSKQRKEVIEKYYEARFPYMAPTFENQEVGLRKRLEKSVASGPYVIDTKSIQWSQAVSTKAASKKKKKTVYVRNSGNQPKN